MSKIFEQMAATYDTPERKNLAAKCTEVLEPIIKLHQSQTMIDIGGGTGLVSLPIAPLVDTLIIWDTAPTMVKLAQDKIDHQHLLNATATLHDFLQQPAQQQADIILLSLVLLHIPDTKAVFDKVFALLRPNGICLIIDFEKNPEVAHPLVHNGFDQGTLDTLSRDAGFIDQQYQVFHQGPNLFMGKPARVCLYTVNKPN